MVSAIECEAGEVCDFYTGKTIFITGAAGFLGSVLLETLLRCCPDISRIYILLRPKKGVSPEERRNLIFEKDIFTSLRIVKPQVLKKVTVITGDISQDNLGLNETDYNSLINEVSIVFHVAATISFVKPLSFIVHQNVMATKTIIDLCRKLKNLEVLVYTSSAYSCSNQKDTIEERIYDLPFSPEEVIKHGRENNEDGLMKLYNMCSPPFPNFYTFSKCVTENFIKKTAQDLPVCIIRPSIIVACLRGPMPGYIEPGSGQMNLCTGVGLGFIRVILADRHRNIELIPADTTANAHVIAAYRHVSERLPSPSMYNCVTGKMVTLTWDYYISSLMKMLKKYPLPGAFVLPMVITCKTRTMYTFLTLLLHYMPAVVADFFLWISGSKFRLKKMYKTYDKTMYVLEAFTMNSWDMKNEQFLSLFKNLNPEEKEMFILHPEDFDDENIVETIPKGACCYRQNGKPYIENFRRTCLRFFLTCAIICFFIGGPASALYLVFLKIFS